MVFLLTLGAMTALIFIGLVGKEAIDRGLGLGPLLRMMPFVAPQAMQFAVPAALLLAVTSVYGRVSAANELVALKAAGVPPWTLIQPTLILAALISMGNVLLNDIAVSWGRLGVDRVFMESLEEVVYGQLRIHREYTMPSMQIAVQKVEGRRLLKPTVTVHDGGSAPWTISAAWAELDSDVANRRLVIRFHDMDLDGRVQYSDPSTFEYVMSLDDLGERSRSTSTLALAEIAPARRLAKASASAARQDMAARATLGMLTGDIGDLSGPVWADVLARCAGAESHENRVRAEPYRRWAAGFSCLGFALIGVPMATLKRKSDFLASFFVCFCPILLIHYPMLALSIDAAKNGVAPPLVVWVGNAALGLWGIWLMRRVSRH